EVARPLRRSRRKHPRAARHPDADHLGDPRGGRHASPVGAALAGRRHHHLDYGRDGLDLGRAHVPRRGVTSMAHAPEEPAAVDDTRDPAETAPAGRPTLAEDLLLLLFQARSGTFAGETTLYY